MLRASQTTSQQLRDPSAPSPKQLHSRLVSFIAFERTCSSLSSAFINVLNINLFLHTFLGYLLLSGHSLSSLITEPFNSLRNSQTVTLLLQLLTYMLNIILLLCLCASHQKYKQKLWYSTLKRVIGFYSILAKISLTLTFFMFYLKLVQNIIAVLLTVTVTLFDAIFIANYHLKKEENYHSSHQSHLILSCWMVLHYGVNGLLMHYGSQRLFCASAAIFGLVFFLWHITKGCRLFMSYAARIIHIIFATLVVSSSMIFFLLVFPEQNQTFNFAQFLVLAFLTAIFLYTYEQKKRFTVTNPQQLILQKKSLKDHQLSMHLLLEESDINKDKQNLLIGVIAHHFKIKCCNQKCWTKEEIVYDPLVKQVFTTKSVVREKDSSLRFYLKCLYQKSLEENCSIENMINYCQFAICQLGDISHQCIVLNQLLQDPNLGFLEKIKLTKLNLLLQEQCDAFNKIIHGGKIQPFEVLHSQETYDFITHYIGEYCKNAAEIWRDTTQREVNISELKQKLSDNFELLPRINEKWNSLSKFLHIQKQWKYLYLNYALFLRNQKIKNRELNLAEYLNEEVTQSTPMNQRKKQTVVVDSIFFDKKSTIVMTTLDQQGLKFSKISKAFEELTHYPQQQVLNCPLNMILPFQLRPSHDKMVKTWLYSGHTTDQNAYNIKHTHLVTKYKEELECMVIFKLHIDLLAADDLLKLLCLIKGGNKREGEFPSKNQTLECVDLQHQGTNEILQRQETNIMLNPSHNIFLKDQNLQPVKHNSQIRRTKIIARLLTFVIISAIVILPLRMKGQVERVDTLSYMEKYFVDMYNFPFLIAGEYYKQLLGVGNQTASAMHIMKLTHMFKYHEDHPQTTKTLFNRSLNPPKYYPPFQPNPTNQNVSYNQYDIFYSILSNIATLSSGTINPSGQDFIQLNDYLKPSFDNMMNTTKQQFHVTIQSSISGFKLEQIVVMTVLGVVLLLAGIWISCQIFSYYGNMRDVLDIIVQFSNTEIDKIVSYWNKIGDNFKKLVKSQQPRLNSNQGRSENGEEEFQSQEIKKSRKNQVSLNQKHKEIISSQEQRKDKCKTVGLVAAMLGGFIPAILLVPISNIRSLQNIEIFQERGYHLLRHFPTDSLAAYTLLHKKFSDSNPTLSTFYFSRFQDVLSSLQMVSKYQFIPATDDSSLFHKKQKNYLFGDPCSYNQAVLAIALQTYDTCISLENRALTSGITAYLRIVYPKIESYLQGTANLTSNQLDNITIGLAISSQYFTDAINTWQTQFSAKLQAFSRTNLVMSILTSLFILALHVAIFEMALLSRMRKNFQFMRLVFSHWVPEHILTNQKVIKHQFYQSGILEAS